MALFRDNKTGEGVRAHGLTVYTEDDAYRFRDMAIVRLRDQGVTWRHIGLIFGIDPDHALRLYREMPEGNRARVAEVLDGMGREDAA